MANKIDLEKLQAKYDNYHKNNKPSKKSVWQYFSTKKDSNFPIASGVSVINHLKAKHCGIAKVKSHKRQNLTNFVDGINKE